MQIVNVVTIPYETNQIHYHERSMNQVVLYLCEVVFHLLEVKLLGGILGERILCETINEICYKLYLLVYLKNQIALLL